MFPAEGCVQVSSRRQRVAFSRAEIGFCRVLLSSIVNKLRSQRYGLDFRYLASFITISCAFAVILSRFPATKEVFESELLPDQ